MQKLDYKKKVELLLQYILTIAAQQDDFEDRSLGEIHLIKYVYIADLEYAKYNNGNIYTGLEWKFHDFGPWSPELYNHIEPLLNLIGAEKSKIQGKHGEFIRWNIKNIDKYSIYKIEKKLPLIIRGSVESSIQKHGSCTESLLDDVYKTPPMLQAAPEETLDFTIIQDKTDNSTINEENCINITDRQKKKRKLLIKDIKRKFQERLKNNKLKTKRVPPPEPPIYDEIFFEGVKYIDSLEGSYVEPIEDEGIITFSDDIWHSKARFDKDDL